MTYRWVDHTAEVELEIEAAGEREVLEEASARAGRVAGRRRLRRRARAPSRSQAPDRPRSSPAGSRSSRSWPSRRASSRRESSTRRAERTACTPPWPACSASRRRWSRPSPITGWPSSPPGRLRGARGPRCLRRAAEIDDELWELPVGTVPGYARPRPGVRRRRAAGRDRAGPLARAARQRGHAARASSTRRWPCPTSTRATASRSAAWRRPTPTDGRDLAGRRRLRHQLRRAPARAAADVRRARGDRREPLVHEISRRVPVGTGGKGAREGLRGREPRPRAVARVRARCSTTSASAREARALTSPSRAGAWRAPTRPRCRRGPGAGRRPDRHARLGQPLPRAPARRGRIRRARGRGVRAARGQLTVLIHSGSRGLGHQVCTDFVKRMDARLGALRDRTAGSPALVRSDRVARGARLPARDGRRRQLRVGQPRGAGPPRARGGRVGCWAPTPPSGTPSVYDVAHNVAKLEQHGGRMVCVHRKGATRAFPPGHPEIPPSTPRSGSRCSSRAAWAPPRSCWPAGPARWSARSGRPATAPAGACRARRCARWSTARSCAGSSRRPGSSCAALSARGLAEEAPEAYKDVDRVVEIVERAGLAGAGRAPATGGRRQGLIGWSRVAIARG